MRYLATIITSNLSQWSLRFFESSTCPVHKHTHALSLRFTYALVSLSLWQLDRTSVEYSRCTCNTRMWGCEVEIGSKFVRAYDAVRNKAPNECWWNCRHRGCPCAAHRSYTRESIIIAIARFACIPTSKTYNGHIFTYRAIHYCNNMRMYLVSMHTILFFHFCSIVWFFFHRFCVSVVFSCDRDRTLLLRSHTYISPSHKLEYCRHRSPLPSPLLSPLSLRHIVQTYNSLTRNRSLSHEKNILNRRRRFFLSLCVYFLYCLFSVLFFFIVFLVCRIQFRMVPHVLLVVIVYTYYCQVFFCGGEANERPNRETIQCRIFVYACRLC